MLSLPSIPRSLASPARPPGRSGHRGGRRGHRLPDGHGGVVGVARAARRAQLPPVLRVGPLPGHGLLGHLSLPDARPRAVDAPPRGGGLGHDAARRRLRPHRVPQARRRPLVRPPHEPRALGDVARGGPAVAPAHQGEEGGEPPLLLLLLLLLRLPSCPLHACYCRPRPCDVARSRAWRACRRA